MKQGTGQGAVPAAAFRMDITVRSYEVGQSGRVGLGSILRYLENLATEASAARGFEWRWYEREGTAWVIRDMRLWLGRLPTIGARLELATWLSGWGRVQAYREYAAWDPETGRLAMRGQARWAYVDRARGTPVRIADEVMARFGPLEHPFHARSLSAPPPATDAHTLLLTARTYEADTNQHINNTVYADWLGEGLTTALPAGAQWQPRLTHITYARPAMPGDSIRVETIITPHGSRGGLAGQRIADAQTGTEHVHAISLYLRV